MRQNSPQTTKYLRALGEAEQVWAAEKDTVPGKPTEGPCPGMILAPQKHWGELFANLSEVCDQHVLLTKSGRGLFPAHWESASR